MLKRSVFINYSKPCLKRPLKIDKTKILMTHGSLMNVERIAECSKVTFCNTFDLHQAIIGLKTVLVFLRVAVLDRFYYMFNFEKEFVH